MDARRYVTCVGAFAVLLLFSSPLVYAQDFREVLKGKATSVNRASSVAFTNASLKRFGTAGNSLLWSRNAQFAANVLSYLVPLVGFSKQTKVNRYGYIRTVESERKLSFLGYLLTIGSAGSSIYSTFRAGRAGSDFYWIGNQFSPNLGINLSEVGNDLRNFRTLSYFSSGIGLAGNLFLTSALNSAIADEEVSTGRLVTGLTLGLTSFVLKIIAVNQVGHAGEKLGRFSQNLKEDWQRYYFAECSSNLQKYNKHWDSGLGFIISGLSIALAGGLAASATEEPALAYVGGISGGIMALAGVIYQDWVAPAAMGSGGAKLYDFSTRKQQSEVSNK
ncbi:MAG: hypothetical protein D6814_04415 [Calditrichaeota bacterium]|nr:MAG: hypothetical protein D6814_04415 [Calditrichota bacterium]